jgi:ABC-type dipeptide/oligopeptide/nickel transport system permease component
LEWLWIIATIARQTRSKYVGSIRQDFITTAKGTVQKEKLVNNPACFKRMLLFPVITVVGSQFGASLIKSMFQKLYSQSQGLTVLLFFTERDIQ